MPKLDKEIKELGIFLEKYVNAMKDEIEKCDEKLKTKNIDDNQKSEIQKQKQELEVKTQKVQPYLDKVKIAENSDFVELGQPKKYWGSTEGLSKPLCERYAFERDDEIITLDIVKELNQKLKLDSKDNFFVAKQSLEKKETGGAITIEHDTEICPQRLLVEKSNKGKIIGTVSGAGTGAAGGAAAGAGLMVLLSPYTFGLSLAFTPAAATVGAIAGGIGGGATGLTAGIIADNISNAEMTKMKGEISAFLEDYKKMMEQISRDCQNETQKEHYDNETKELKAYIESNNNLWK